MLDFVRRMVGDKINHRVSSFALYKCLNWLNTYRNICLYLFVLVCTCWYCGRVVFRTIYVISFEFTNFTQWPTTNSLHCPIKLKLLTTIRELISIMGNNKKITVWEWKNEIKKSKKMNMWRIIIFNNCLVFDNFILCLVKCCIFYWNKY